MAQMRDNKTKSTIIILAGGLLFGIATAMFLGVRRRRRSAMPTELRRIEDGVIDALRHDAMMHGRGIDVAAIAPGIIELSGSVDSEMEAHHAVTVARTVRGVSTVLNRLDVREGHRLRGRQPSGAAAGTASRWYGMNSGMGSRRQSLETEPAQRDDKATMIDQALAPDAAGALADLTEERSEKRELGASKIS
jgi:BON domain-containing protein